MPRDDSLFYIMPHQAFRKWNQWREKKAIDRHCRHLDEEARKPRTPAPKIRRTLTLSSQSRTGLGSIEHNPQHGSLLYHKLPTEIRHLIFTEVIGHQIFHIVQKGYRLAFLLCEGSQGINHTKARCWGYSDLNHRFIGRFHEPRIPPALRHPVDEIYMATTDGGLLPLLLTCKLVYSDSIDILYSQNTFAFQSQQVFYLFRSIVPSQRLATIRHLHMELTYIQLKGRPRGRCLRGIRSHGMSILQFENEEEWTTLWSSVRELSGLRTLEAKILTPPIFSVLKRDKQALPILRKEDGEFEDFGLLAPFQAMGQVEMVNLILPEACRISYRDNGVLNVVFRDREEMWAWDQIWHPKCCKMLCPRELQESESQMP